MTQGGGGEIRGPASAEPGTTIEIEVQGEATEVEVGVIGSDTSTKYPVGPDGKAQIPVPPNTAGLLLLIGTVGPFPPGSLSIPIISTG
jgi:hypothetical protein